MFDLFVGFVDVVVGVEVFYDIYDVFVILEIYIRWNSFVMYGEVRVLLLCFSNDVGVCWELVVLMVVVWCDCYSDFGLVNIF